MKKLLSVLICFIVLSSPLTAFAWQQADESVDYSSTVNVDSLIKQAFVDNKNILYFYYPDEQKYFLYIYSYSDATSNDINAGNYGSNILLCYGSYQAQGYGNTSGVYYYWDVNSSTYESSTEYKVIAHSSLIYLAGSFVLHRDDNTYMKYTYDYREGTYQNLTPVFELSASDGLINGYKDEDEGEGDSNGFSLSALTNWFSGKFSDLYNILMYGSTEGEAALEYDEFKLDEFKDNLDDVVQRVSDAADSVDAAGQGVASYVSTFTEFYNGVTALNVGVSAVLLFAFMMMFVKKLIGR